jgi:hypothetical protein
MRDGKLCVMTTSTLGSVPSIVRSKHGYQVGVEVMNALSQRPISVVGMESARPPLGL